MTATPSTPSAGSKRLVNQNGRPVSRTIASPSGRATHESRHAPPSTRKRPVASSGPRWIPNARKPLPGAISGTAAAQSLRCKVAVSALRRFSFCNSCRSLHFRKSPTAGRDVSVRADPHLRQSEIDLARRERAGTPIAKLFSTTTLTAPSGASREKNEGRGCQAEGEPCAG
jgi:hypothetical protein